MKIRMHRRSLTDAMLTTEIIDPTKQAIVEWVWRNYRFQTKVDHISCTPHGYDNRINWDTYIVSVDGFGVVGFADQGIVED